jgi:trans-aconitate methyltransferase
VGDTSWDPASYPREIREEIPRYDELKQRVMQATRGLEPRTILELGTGAGETAHLVLALHPEARMLVVDSSPAMLAARGALPVERVEFARPGSRTSFPPVSSTSSCRRSPCTT